MGNELNEKMNQAKALLKTHFGYDSFRKSQNTIIQSLLSNRDVLAIMPTGAGKSICYQIPALMFDGISIVISPLISLMHDQVKSLKETNISFAYIISTLSYSQSQKVLSNILDKKYKLIYVAPERLSDDEFIKTIQKQMFLL